LSETIYSIRPKKHICVFTVKEGIGGLGLWRLSVLLVEETGVPLENVLSYISY
jgi:hypothetical protein